MEIAASIGVVGLLYVGLFHTRINQWVVLIGAVVVSNVLHVVMGTAEGPLGWVSFAVLFVVAVVGLAARRMDSVIAELDDPVGDPAMVRADGVALVEHLERGGFERAPEGWLHFDRLGWDAIVMQNGTVNSFTISGDKGPLTELSTVLDDGHVVTTISSARDRVLPHVLRQCFPDQDIEVLLREHRLAVEWAETMGRRPQAIPMDELTDRILSEEREGGVHVRRSVAGSMVREVRRQHLDVGTIIDRPDVVARLHAGRRP